MATVYRKTYTKPLPDPVELFTRKGEPCARWKDHKGKKQTARVTTGKDGSKRIIVEARTFTAKYRDGSGVVREVATGCRDETAARAVLADLEKRAELVKAKVMTAEQDSIADHQNTPLAEHFGAYDAHLRMKQVTKTHREDRGRHLRRLAADCTFSKLCDLKRSSLERWLSVRADEGMSARSRNAYRASAMAFCNWCIETRRLTGNPFTGVPKANEKADPRRKRRALTEDELVKLLDVASRRPVLDAMTIRRGKRIRGKPSPRSATGIGENSSRSGVNGR